jgi:hypothetical protein
MLTVAEASITFKKIADLMAGRNPGGLVLLERSPSRKENCRNCSAPHDGCKCEYCGTLY